MAEEVGLALRYLDWMGKCGGEVVRDGTHTEAVGRRLCMLRGLGGVDGCIFHLQKSSTSCRQNHDIASAN